MTAEMTPYAEPFVQQNIAPMPPTEAVLEVQRKAATMLFRYAGVSFESSDSESLGVILGRVAQALRQDQKVSQRLVVDRWLPQWTAHLQGYSDEKIASEVKLSPITVRQNRSNSYKTLRRIIGEYGANFFFTDYDLPVKKQVSRPALKPSRQMVIDKISNHEWYEEAACKNSTVDFVPERYNKETTKEAISLCSSCDVRQDCLTDALLYDEEFTVRGGMTPAQRRAYYRMREQMYLANQSTAIL